MRVPVGGAATGTKPHRLRALPPWLQTQPSRYDSAGRLQDVVAKGHRVVVLPVAGSVHEGHRSLDQIAAQSRQPGVVGGQFLEVAAAEVVPAGRVLAEPAAQGRAGRE